MPSLPPITFQNLHDILEECKEYIPHITNVSITNTLDFAYDNDDQVVILPICWLVLQTRLAVKSIREIVNIFYSKVEISTSTHYNQYKTIAETMFVNDAVNDAIG